MNLAVVNENIEIIKLLISNDKLDINLGNILSIIIYKNIFESHSIQFKITFSNAIQKYFLNTIYNHIFQIQFNIIFFNLIRNHIFQ